MNLIPQAAGSAPNYFCTWSTQNYGREDADREADIAVFEGDQGAKKARLFLNDDVVFSPGGMIDQFGPIRRDLYFVFDDGWDVPYGVHPDTQRYRFGTLELDEERFPSCRGETPAERLKRLNERVKSFGWRGAGLWVAAQAEGDGKDGRLMDDAALERYWRERARWCREAGIAYWKVDWGARSRDTGFRDMLTRVAREEAPGLIVEHGRGCGPLNDSWTPWDPAAIGGEGRFRSWGRVLEEALEMLSFSDVLRSYDVTMPLSTATTIDRVASLLQGAPASAGDAQRLVNCEDELYLGAALGCTVGIMRSPLFKHIPGLNYDPRNTANSADEAVRAVRWQRIAPAYGAGQGDVVFAGGTLVDTWRFSQGETWATWLIGKEERQACPAVVARGVEPPEVRCDGEPPFIVASRHPNGAVSAAALPRTMTVRGIHTPRAHIALNVGDSTAPFAFFGCCASVAFRFGDDIRGKRIWAQDLAGDEAVDITARVAYTGDGFRVPGDVVDEIGRSAASPGDVSEPGIVFGLR